MERPSLWQPRLIVTFLGLNQLLGLPSGKLLVAIKTKITWRISSEWTFLRLNSCCSRFCFRSWIPSSSLRLRISCESRPAFLYLLLWALPAPEDPCWPDIIQCRSFKGQKNDLEVKRNKFVTNLLKVIVATQKGENMASKVCAKTEMVKRVSERALPLGSVPKERVNRWSCK